MLYNVMIEEEPQLCYDKCWHGLTMHDKMTKRLGPVPLPVKMNVVTYHYFGCQLNVTTLSLLGKARQVHLYR